MYLSPTQLTCPENPTVDDWDLAWRRFTQGSCGDLAWALSELLGLEMALVGHELGGHVIVVDDSAQLGLDITGWHPVSTIMDEFAFHCGGMMRCELTIIEDGDELAAACELAGKWGFDGDLAMHWAKLLIACDFQPPPRDQ